jgi:opacity protein-like surface antigen
MGESGRRRGPAPALWGLAFTLALGADGVAASAMGAGGWLFDREYLRGYVGLRYGQSLYADGRISPLLEVADNRGNDAYNALIGLELSRYLGLELALNYLEGDITSDGFGKLGEQTVYTLVPQIRLRYPLDDGRLEPYLIGGIGIGVSEFSDGTVEAMNRPDAVIPTSRETAMAATLGAGVQYYLAPNLALDLEAKYIFFSADTETKRGRTPPQDVPDPPAPVPGVGEPGPKQTLDLDNVVFSAGFRMYFPQAGAADRFRGVRWPAAGEDDPRGYLALRVGGWWLQSGKACRRSARRACRSRRR